jgi:HEAT repeat protein
MEDIELLIASLRDSDMNIKSDAAIKLLTINDPEAVERLISALSDQDHWVRQTAAHYECYPPTSWLS